MLDPGASETILILHADDAIAEGLARQLARAGYRTQRLATASQALAEASVTAPRLIILDLDLAGEEALPLLTRLRAQPRLARAAIVATSARQAAAGADADDFVAGPCDLDHLIGRIERQLARTVFLAPPRSGPATQRGCERSDV